LVGPGTWRAGCGSPRRCSGGHIHIYIYIYIAFVCFMPMLIPVTTAAVSLTQDRLWSRTGDYMFPHSGRMSSPVATIHEYDISGSTIPLQAIVIYIYSRVQSASRVRAQYHQYMYPSIFDSNPASHSLQYNGKPSAATSSHAVDDRHVRCLLASWLSYHLIPFFLTLRHVPILLAMPNPFSYSLTSVNPCHRHPPSAGTAGARTPIDLVLRSPRAAWVGGDCERPTLYGSAHPGGPLP
jgi:hypothetical protein